MNKIFYKKMKSPLGELSLVASDTHLLAVLWDGDKSVFGHFHAEKAPKGHKVLQKAERQLKEYFDRKRKIFDLPIELRGTQFQEKVWRGLCTIPYGQTVSYKWLAKKIGSEKAVRAVGAANGKNWLGIVVPCHRVIGADGSLVGFGGGLNRKKILLGLESSLNQLELDF